VPERLNGEQLQARVILVLAGSAERPVSAAREVIALVAASCDSTGGGVLVPVSPGRGRELAGMPYQEYLETPEWQQRRKIMLKRAGYQCQVCGNGTELHTHHNTYKRRGAELATDLVVLCSGCHRLFHGLAGPESGEAV
jgi:hypothetical protein